MLQWVTERHLFFTNRCGESHESPILLRCLVIKSKHNDITDVFLRAAECAIRIISFVRNPRKKHKSATLSLRLCWIMDPPHSIARTPPTNILSLLETMLVRAVWRSLAQVDAHKFSGLIEDTLLSGGVSLRGLMFWQLDFPI